MAESVISEQRIDLPCGLSFTATVSVRERTADEERVRQLHLRATELKKSDIEAAAMCLCEAQAIARREQLVGYPFDWWLRLPVFLQQAGRMQEATEEFDLIESEVRARAETVKWTGSAGKMACLRAIDRKRDLARRRELAKSKGVQK